MTTTPNNLRTSANGIALIKRHEGLRLNVYLCPAGKPTIGYGHMLLRSELHIKTITQAQADAFLAADCRIAEMYLNANVRVDLNQQQFDALVSFCFNLGVGAFDRSTMRRMLNNRDYAGAANQFLRWNKIKNPRTGQFEISRGLNNRRIDERNLFLRGANV